MQSPHAAKDFQARALKTGRNPTLALNSNQGRNLKLSVVVGPRNHRCARHHRSLVSSGPLALGGAPVTTPALGDLISVALPTMAIPVEGRVAAAVQIYSDNSDEVTGATLNGGVWTKAGEVWASPTVLTADRAVFGAEMRTANTLGRHRHPKPDQPGERAPPDVQVAREEQAGLIHHPEIGIQIGTQLAGTG